MVRPAPAGHGSDPKIAAPGVDAGGGFVEQQQCRVVQDAGGRAGAASSCWTIAWPTALPGGKSQLLQGTIDTVAQVGKAIDVTDEIEIFADGEVYRG
jgi:hypothetical protein